MVDADYRDIATVRAEDVDGFTAFSILHDILDKTLTTTEGITHKQRREVLKAMDNIILHDEQLRTLLMEVMHYGRQ
jgi:hypothetical protein